MKILGLSAYYHDSAAALLIDGTIAAAAQEERFTRLKHDASLPRQAIDWCLSSQGLSPQDLDYVVFYDKPLLKFDRILESSLATVPGGWRSFLSAMPVWLKRKLHLRREIARAVPGYRRPIAFTSHHESHAASAFFPSPFEEAAILTVDGVGEWETATIGHGRGNRIELRQALRFPHSLGLLYSAFTYFCGFKVNSGEYKLMGLAPYGTPRYRDLILEHLIHLKPDGSFRLRMEYFEYARGLRMTGDRFARLFGGPPRLPESPLGPREADLAASIQAVTEEILLRMARHAHELTGARDLCLAGGVALNCVANGRIQREGTFRRVWIQPAAGDAGGALGAALLLHHQLLDQPRRPQARDSMRGARLGPAFTPAEVEQILRQRALPYHAFSDESALLEAAVDALAAGKVVGWFQGAMEFGPRALGGRSILGDPRRPDMQSRMNLQIKFRESFRPFAPSVLAHHCRDWFELDGESPYMLLVGKVHPRHWTEVGADAAGADGFDLRQRINRTRSAIPAVTHVDHSARVQTVDEARGGRYARLLESFHARTGCPLLINTSFNVRGEPIVRSPADAIHGFLLTDMDTLVLEHCILHKHQQAPMDEGERRRYLDNFQLD